MPRVRLTEAVVRAAVAESGKRKLLQDTVQEGLNLAVQPSGSKSYKLYYKRGKKTRWFHLGPVSALTLAEARAEVKRQLAKIHLDDSYDPQAARQESRHALTWRELWEQHIRDAASRKTKSWDQKRRALERHTSGWDRRPAGTIRRRDVKKLHRDITNAGTPTQADVVLAHVSAVFDWAIREELIQVEVNPARGIERNGTQSRERVLSEDELSRAWRYLTQADDPWHAALLVVLLTGQRPGEVAAMRRADVRGRWWTLPGEPAAGWPGTKNGQTHAVYLSDPALGLVERHAGRATHVFRGRTNKPVSGLPARMKKLSTDLELEPPVRPHDLRRTFATTVIRLGWSRESMDRLLNHRPGGVGGVYDRWDRAPEFKEIAEAVAREFRRLGHGLQMVG